MATCWFKPISHFCWNYNLFFLIQHKRQSLLHQLTWALKRLVLVWKDHDLQNSIIYDDLNSDRLHSLQSSRS